MMKRLAFLIIALFFSLTAWANYPDSPKPFRYVSDYAQTLSPTETQTLENALKDYASKTSSQIAVVIVPTTNGEAVSAYAFNLGEKWGIGRQKLNNGVLMLVAKNDRKIFIATGRGLEGALPDATTASIIRNEITPYFRQNQYAQGIAKGLSAIVAATQGEYAALEPSEQADDTFYGLNGFEIFLIIGLVIFFLFAPKGGRVYVSPSAVDQVFSTIRTHNRSGGLGGGFGGGFSGRRNGNNDNGGGFGGGSFGGGGAGGSW